VLRDAAEAAEEIYEREGPKAFGNSVNLLQSLGRPDPYHAAMPRPPRLDVLDDDALLAALGLGEPGAAVVFVRRFQSRVFGLAYLITGDRTTAEDVAQQAFERAWRHAGSFDPRRGSVASWLLTITRNVAIDVGRVRRAQPIDPVELMALLPVSGSPDPQESGERRDVLDRLRPLLDALPAEQRRAVLLATIAGRTTAEIGEIEQIPVATAKTRLRTGLGRLQRGVVARGLA
jgi:RNA polymerase sigma factor (sigma-70 family)